MDLSHDIITTFGSALFFGILFIIISNKLKVPSIVILLAGGIILGPSSLGLKIINPEYLGDGLNSVIQLAVALILFEGGLTLDVKGYKEVSSEIRRALTIGVVVTWVLSTIAIKLFFNFSLAFSVLSGSLIIVTGPTVIGPLLKRIKVQKKIHNFLHWEGVLIDPIGVFIALLCYEWMIGQNAIEHFLFRIVTGVGIGFVGGYILYQVIKRHWVSEGSLNVFILSYAVIIFVLSGIIIPESGLMSVIITGFAVGYSDLPQIDSIKIYKAQLIDLLIGLLFILLAANLDIASFSRHYGIKMVFIVLIVMFVIRPLNILFVTFRKNKFNIREKIFLSWIAPRGIVAASMASLFAINLKNTGNPEYSLHYDFLEAFTYAVICGTVIFQGFSAKYIGGLLKVLEPKPTGWLIVSAHNLARFAAQFITSIGYSVTLVDINMHSVKVARREGLDAIAENALTLNPDDYPEIYDIGNILVITSNEDRNELVCQMWLKKLSYLKLYKWEYSSKVEEKSMEVLKTAVGKIVWPSIELDKIVTTGRELKDLGIIKKNVNVSSIKHRDRVLMYYSNGVMKPYVPDDAEGKCTCLMYQPLEIEVDLNIMKQWVIFSDAASMSGIIKELLAIIKKDFPKIKTNKLHKLLLEQEKEYSSIIGYNIALPHAYIEGIDNSVVMVAKIFSPVTCRYDGGIIDFVFLVLSPKDQPNTHIETLAKISKFVSNENNLKLMQEALSRKDLLKLFFPD